MHVLEMVSKKRLDCGSNGFNAPNIPRAPRSCRRRARCKSTDDNIQICAFDLLASLAGKLLQESESSSASTNAFEGNNHYDIGKEVKREQLDECKELKTEFTDPGICDSKSSTENTTEKCVLNEFPSFENDEILDGTSLLSGRLCKKQGCDLPSKLEGGFTGESCDFSVNNVTEHHQEGTKGLGNGCLSAANTCNSKDTAELRMPFPELINYNGDIKFPSCMEPIANDSFTRHRNHSKLCSRDDDENFFRCNDIRKKCKSYRPPTRIGDRRIRMLLSSKYWKGAPKLKDVEHARADRGLKLQYHKRKKSYGHNRYQRDTVYKRRKLSDRGSMVTSDGRFSSKSVSNSTEKSETANGVISHLHSKGSHVKFSIKSFKIPELLIEVPETTTVGSLKSTVLEAVTALLGGGIRLGILFQGKKVRDDNKTLSQTGIFCRGNQENLRFTLEPGPEKVYSTICSEDPHSIPPGPDAANLSKRPPALPTMDSGIPSSCPNSLSLPRIENNLELVPYQTETAEEPLSDSRALVRVSAMNQQSLAVVPVSQKPKRSELAQRRTRRPFSVSEVEALVQAVEEIGTGRWRDVKLCAFENADHRTYVDLKDKWKTLVHTASISPHQRRGEPVPQVLLDRVLAAHGYWSQHQAKQHCKNQSGAPTANGGLM